MTQSCASRQILSENLLLKWSVRNFMCRILKSIKTFIALTVRVYLSYFLFSGSLRDFDTLQLQVQLKYFVFLRVRSFVLNNFKF